MKVPKAVRRGVQWLIHWQIIKLTYSESDVELRRKISYLAVGAEFTFAATLYSSQPDEFGQGEITWSVANGTGNASISENGKLVGNMLGTVTVTARYSGTTRSESHDVQIIPADGIYLISNRQTGLYADVKDQIMADDSLIHQWESHKGDTQRWLLAHRGNGYFTIKSLYSGSTAYYLSVKDDSAALSVESVLAFGVITNGMLWKLEPTTNSAFKLIPKSGEANGYVLATTTSAPEITQTIIDRTHEQLIAEMEQFDFEYTITEQTGRGVYDARTNSYYYELSAAYELLSGAAGVYSSRYRISEGETQ